MLPLLVMTMVLIVVFWMLIIRPQQQRQQDHRNFVETLAPGDLIEAFSGIRGTIAEVGDDAVGVEVAPGVVVTMAKLAISSRIEPDDGPDRTEGRDQLHEGDHDVTTHLDAPAASATTEGAAE